LGLDPERSGGAKSVPQQPHRVAFCMSDVLRRKTQTCRVTVAFLYVWSARSGLVGKGMGKRLRFLCALISALRKKKKKKKKNASNACATASSTWLKPLLEVFGGFWCFFFVFFFFLKV
jgi:hypothetical protein